MVVSTNAQCHAYTDIDYSTEPLHVCIAACARTSMVERKIFGMCMTGCTEVFHRSTWMVYLGIETSRRMQIWYIGLAQPWRVTAARAATSVYVRVCGINIHLE